MLRTRTQTNALFLNHILLNQNCINYALYTACRTPAKAGRRTKRFAVQLQVFRHNSIYSATRMLYYLQYRTQIKD